MATLISAIETQVRRYLLEPASLSTPGTPTITPQGTAGSTAYSYKVVARNATGTTDAGTAGSTSTGNATLDGTNYNRITWTAVTNATGYEIYRTASAGTPATTGWISSLGAVTTLDDTGLTGDSTTAPTSNTTGLNSAFWTSAELVAIVGKGCKELWRPLVDLKQEYYLTVDITNVSLAANTATLTGIPADVYKIYLIEPRDVSSSSSNKNLFFKPLDYNHPTFQAARTRSDIDPSDDIIYYALVGQGAPTGAPTVYVAPQVSSAVNLAFTYVPTLADSDLEAGDNVPLPGEADSALIYYTIAHARAKEREDRSPDPSWLAMFSTEKQNLLNSLGLRNLQEPTIVDGMFDELW